MHPGVDPESPVPLYHQIAEAIRARIARGELQAGDALQPMRQAADRWGVNLHTVRHAYAALAREGLLEMRSARGTRVTSEAALLRKEAAEDADGFVARFLREAGERYGLSAMELSARVTSLGDDRLPEVTVVECSPWQCDAHAAELASLWQVDARPWPLTQEGEPEGDAILTTFFHYNDIRRRWPQLLERVRFLTVRVDGEMERWLGGAPSAVVVERDAPTGEAVAADLKTALGREIELTVAVSEDPAALIAELSGEPVLCSPRVWSDLPPETRAAGRCAVVRYRFDEAELEALARDLAWTPTPKTARATADLS